MARIREEAKLAGEFHDAYLLFNPAGVYITVILVITTENHEFLEVFYRF